MSPKDIAKKLESSQNYLLWREGHTKGFLSHFFCVLTSDVKESGSWEVGYYAPDKEKITVFVCNDTFQIKPEDDVFKKKATKVEPLELEKINSTSDEVLVICKENLASLFPKEIVGNGFVILQTFNGKTIWNFTFISKSLKFLNLHISADKKEVINHRMVEAISKS